MIQQITLGDFSLNSLKLPLKKELEDELMHFLESDSSSWAKGRRQEYIAGRACACESLKQLLIFDFKILRKKNRAPIWPLNIIGSITHSKNEVFTVALEQGEYQGIGIDCEVLIDKKKFLSLSSHIATAIDISFLQNSQMDEKTVCTLIFSAKESLYKALNPIVDIFFGFEHASIVKINEAESTFIIELNSTLESLKKFNKTYHGFYKISNNQILTLVTV